MGTKAELYQIVADTLINNSFDVVTCVPGFGATQVFERILNTYPKLASQCFNEEAAFSVCTGASLFGARSACLVKTHGLAKMANAVCSTLSVGTNAANIIFAFDDSTGKSSDNIFDAKKLIEGLDAPFVIANDDIESSIDKAIEISERLKLPVIVYIDCEVLNKEYHYNSKKFKYSKTKFQKNPNQYVACPPLSKYQRAIFLNKKDSSAPLTIEEPNLSKLIPSALPPHLKKVFNSYEFFFDAFSEIKPDFVSGDAGTSSLFAFHHNSYIDACTYMGGSPGMALGAYLAGAKNSWSITGDFSFLAAGILGFNEIISRNAPIKIVVFRNGIAGATGGQNIPSAVFDNFIKGHSHLINNIEHNITNNNLVTRLEEINEVQKPQIIIVNLN